MNGQVIQWRTEGGGGLNTPFGTPLDHLPIHDNFFRSELAIAFGVPHKQQDRNSLTIYFMILMAHS